MKFLGHLKIPRNVSKKVFLQLSDSTRCISSKPVNLSFVKILPNEVTNSIPVIICHGFLGSKQNWRSLAKAIAFKSGREVYVLDARNHGDSPHSNNFSINLMCEDLKHFMSSQSILTTILVGHSMGGRTAMKVALTEKHLVDKLVVVDVSPIRMPESSYISIPLYMVAMQKVTDSIENVGIVQARKLVDQHLSQSIPDATVRQFLLTNLIEKDKKIVWKANIDVLEKTFQQEICDYSQFSGYYLGNTLFICGGRSPYVKVDDYSSIKKLFPEAEFVVIPGAGHWVHSERPSDFLTALCNFL